MDKKITLKDIAKKTGYSTITVSKALRDHSDLSEDTKNYIKKTADDLGYVKNASATSLRTGSTFTLALIISDITNPFFGILARHIELYAKKNGYTVIVLNTDEVPHKEVDAVNVAISANVDGVLLVPCQKDDAAVKILESRNMPYVIMGRFFADTPRHTVLADDYYGGYLVTSHLLDQGYSRILMLNAEPNISAATERLRGYIQAHLDRNLVPQKELCVYGKSTTGECEETLAKCSALGYDAIFAYNDILALQAIALLQRQGIRVPEEIAIAGFDDITAFIGYLQPITSVAVSFDSFAENAVNQLLASIKHQPIKMMTKLPVTLNVRGSTPPKKTDV